jgi:hypothetical protein
VIHIGLWHVNRSVERRDGSLGEITEWYVAYVLEKVINRLPVRVSVIELSRTNYLLGVVSSEKDC